MTVDTLEGSTVRGSTAVVTAGALLVVTVALLGGAAAAHATAGDQPTVIYTPQENYSVPAGDTLTVDVYARSDGGVDDIGVEAMTVVTDYDESLLTVENVEPASWMEGDESTSIESDVQIDEDAGEVSVEQWRDPPAGGTTGDERFVTITFAADADAAMENTTLGFENSDVRLTDEYNVPIFDNKANISIGEPSDDGAAGSNDDLPMTLIGGAAALGLVAVVAVGGAVMWRRE